MTVRLRASPRAGHGFPGAFAPKRRSGRAGAWAGPVGLAPRQPQLAWGGRWLVLALGLARVARGAASSTWFHLAAGHGAALYGARQEPLGPWTGQGLSGGCGGCQERGRERLRLPEVAAGACVASAGPRSEETCGTAVFNGVRTHGIPGVALRGFNSSADTVWWRRGAGVGKFLTSWCVTEISVPALRQLLPGPCGASCSSFCSRPSAPLGSRS